jgi:hypothetical protein
LPGTVASPWQAIGLVCLAGVLFVAMNAIVKALTGEYPIVVLLWARFFFHVLTWRSCSRRG